MKRQGTVLFGIGVMHKANGLTMVMGDFNASIGESVQGVIGLTTCIGE